MYTKLEMALDKSGLLISKSGTDRNVGPCWLWREGRAGFLTENSHGLWYFPSGLVLSYVFRRLLMQMVGGIDAPGNSVMLGGWASS